MACGANVAEAEGPRGRAASLKGQSGSGLDKGGAITWGWTMTKNKGAPVGGWEDGSL